VKTFAQTFNIALGTTGLEDYFKLLSDDDINKKQAFEAENA